MDQMTAFYQTLRACAETSPITAAITLALALVADNVLGNVGDCTMSDKAKVGPIGVLHCRVQAYSGSGNVVAVVRSTQGNVRLLGITNLVNAGVLPDRYAGKYLKADVLSDLLKVPLVIGADDARKFLSDNGCAELVSSVLSDCVVRLSGAKSGNKGKGIIGLDW